MVLKRLPQEKVRFTGDLVDKKTVPVLDPPCGLDFIVQFKDGKCPYSGYKTCKECVPNKHHLRYLRMLIEADSSTLGLV